MSNMDIVHGKGYSLLQKVMYARHQGEEKITLYLEDAEQILEDQKKVDELVVKLMAHVPNNILKGISIEKYE